MEQRFFVTVFAADESAFRDLTNLNLDLFGSRSSKKGESSVGGLLTKSQIKKLEKAGYRVEVHQEYVEQARVSAITESSQVVEVMDDKQWLEAFYAKKKKVK